MQTGTMPFGSPLQLETPISVLNEHSTIIGRDYKEIEKSIILRCLIRETDDELNRNIRKWKRKDETTEHLKKARANTLFLSKQYVNLGVIQFILHFVAFNIQCLKLFNSKVIKKI